MSDRIERVSLPYWKTITGQPAHYAGGRHFSANQGEYHQLHGRWATMEAQIRLVQVEDGTWLADSCAYQDEPRYPTRDEALIAAVQNVEAKVTWASRDSGLMPPAHANEVIKWAYSILGAPAPAPLQPPPTPEAKGQLRFDI